MKIAIGQDRSSQQLETMMSVLADLSRRVQAMEEHQKQMAASNTATASTSHPYRRGMSCQPFSIREPELVDEVWQRVAKVMRQVPLFTLTTTDEDSTSEEEQSAP